MTICCSLLQLSSTNSTSRIPVGTLDFLWVCSWASRRTIAASEIDLLFENCGFRRNFVSGEQNIHENPGHEKDVTSHSSCQAWSNDEFHEGYGQI